MELFDGDEQQKVVAGKFFYSMVYAFIEVWKLKFESQ